MLSVPDYQSVMLSLLQLAGHKNEYIIRTPVEILSIEFRLMEEKRNEMLPSGTAPHFDNRVVWARKYLKQARLLRSTKLGIFL